LCQWYCWCWCQPNRTVRWIKKRANDSELIFIIIVIVVVVVVFAAILIVTVAAVTTSVVAYTACTCHSDSCRSVTSVGD
jgi:flagellar basal body-associated protein FliL